MDLELLDRVSHRSKDDARRRSNQFGQAAPALQQYKSYSIYTK